MKYLMKTLRVNPIGHISASLLSSWRPDLKVWHHWVSDILSIARLVMGGINKSRGIQVAQFTKYASKIARMQGRKGLALHLKVALVCLMQSLPGSALQPNSREIGSVGVARANDGMPRLIPGFARRLIRAGDLPTIRLWMSLLGMYRVLEFKGYPDISTIEARLEIDANQLDEWEGFLPTFVKNLSHLIDEKVYDLDPRKDLERPEVLSITKTGANSPPGEPGARFKQSAFGARCAAAACWVHGWGNFILMDPTRVSISDPLTKGEERSRCDDSAIFNYLREIGQTETTKSLWTLICETAQFEFTRQEIVDNYNKGLGCGFFAGKLAQKAEPGGKVRLFAIVDYWTQVALKPLHSFIFGILKEVPEDGTFEQLKPVRILLERVGPSQKVYSYDLKAATDLIPVVLQEKILAVVFGPTYAEAWKNLLVGRYYAVGFSTLATGNRRKKDYRKGYYPKGKFLPNAVKYTVGQPMGALSSWGMLALTHHALVQFSAYRLGRQGWFSNYAVLGDDLIIADDGVAAQYVQVCAAFGIRIGLAKSLISNNQTAEFAKRFFHKNVDVSGLPHSLWAVSQQSVGVCHALVARISLQCQSSLANVAKALGAGLKAYSSLGSTWKNIPKRLRVLAVILTHPLAKTHFSRKEWLLWLLQEGPQLPVQYREESSWFTPWCTGLYEGFIRPAVEQAEDAISEIFFDNPNMDPAARLLDARANDDLVRIQESLAKAEATVKHLQKLNIKFMLHQSSAIFDQLTKVVDRAQTMTPSSVTSSRKVLTDKVLLKGTSLLATWNSVRSWARSVRPGEKVTPRK